jgi:sugar lactone lactonase YvrE
MQRQNTRPAPAFAVRQFRCPRRNREAVQSVIQVVHRCRPSERARRRTPLSASEHRRRFLASGVAIVTAVVLAGTSSAYASVRQGSTSLVAASQRGRSSGLPYADVYVVPKAPNSLAIGPNGNLFIADGGRDQVLERLPNGKFVVVAGNGKRGFSGDGGPALNAELNYPGGIAFGPDGDLYIVDEANNRVRRVAPDGAITTVVGAAGRWEAPVANGTPALQARLLSPEDVTFGPGGELYIADTGDKEVLRLGPADKLVLVAGSPHIRYAGVYNMGKPATEASPDGPAGIAFDRAGDLFIFGVNTKALLMVEPHGVIRAIVGQKPETGFFPHSSGGIVTAPDGEVFGLDDTSLDRITTTGARTVVDFTTDPLTRNWRAFLPNGIAVLANRSIYVDTDGASGYTQTPGIVEIVHDGEGRVIWKG